RRARRRPWSSGCGWARHANVRGSSSPFACEPAQAYPGTGCRARTSRRKVGRMTCWTQTAWANMRRMPIPSVLVMAFVVGASALVGCGGDVRPPAAAPEAPAGAAPIGAPRDESSELAELDRAEAELDRAFGPKKKAEESAPVSPGARPLSETETGNPCDTA